MPTLQTARLDPRDRYLRVAFGDGHHADFHWFWLRQECDHDRHPQTRERTLCASRVPVDVRPRRVELEGDHVVVTWNGEDARPPSQYSLEFLASNAYATDRDDVPPPPSNVARLESALDGVLLPPDWLARLDRHGALVARSANGIATEDDTERMIDQASRSGLSIIGTHFGRIEDLRTDNTTNQNTDQLGYTDAGIDLHTDQPFLDSPPRYQLLHCIRAADEGGGSLLADAQLAAEHLGSIDAESLRLLREVKVRFHRKQRAFERIVDSPILSEVDGHFAVRHSPFTLAPRALPFELLEGWQRAYARFVGILEANSYRFALGPGDVLLYDNHRMVHGRTAFLGPRWVRGVYFDRRSE